MFKNRPSHKKNLFLNYLGLAISFFMFNAWHSILYSFVLYAWKNFILYIILFVLFLFIHLNIAKLVMNKIISKRKNIQISKSYREYHIFSVFYLLLWFAAAFVFRVSKDPLDAVVVRYFLISFFSNFVLFLIYKKKYKNIISYAKETSKQ